MHELSLLDTIFVSIQDLAFEELDNFRPKSMG